MFCHLFSIDFVFRTFIKVWHPKIQLKRYIFDIFFNETTILVSHGFETYNSKLEKFRSVILHVKYRFLLTKHSFEIAPRIIINRTFPSFKRWTKHSRRKGKSENNRATVLKRQYIIRQSESFLHFTF